MDELDRELIVKLYEAGAIKVIVSTYKLCWELNLVAYMVAVLDNFRYDGLEKRYIDYTIPDLLQMMNLANDSNLDNN
jgi:pre-mRNA-splicing helicase BRR2